MRLIPAFFRYMSVLQEFERTKHDFGQCPLIHDDDAKARWEALDDAGKERLGHEHALMKWLDQLMADLSAKIKKNTERLKAEQESPVYLKDDQVCMAQMCISGCDKPL